MHDVDQGNKHADVCGVSSRNFDARLKDQTFKKDDFHVSTCHPPFSLPPLAYSTKLPEQVRNKIRAAVLEAHKHGKIGGYGGEMARYIPVTDSDYDLLREVETLLDARK